jgi:hypothetical protein
MPLLCYRVRIVLRGLKHDGVAEVVQNSPSKNNGTSLLVARNGTACPDDRTANSSSVHRVGAGPIAYPLDQPID